jgi:RNA-directed DNA polymerase
MQAARQRIRAITDRRLLLRPPEEVVAELNRFLIGWGGYFRRGNSSRHFDKIDHFAFDRVARFLGERHQSPRPLRDGRGLLARRRDLIPRRLVGTIRARPAHAAR